MTICHNVQPEKVESPISKLCARFVKLVEMFLHLHVFWNISVFIFPSFFKCRVFLLMEMLWAAVTCLQLSATV